MGPGTFMTWLKVIYCQASSVDYTNFSPNRLGVVQLCCYPRLLKAETPYRGRTSVAARTYFTAAEVQWNIEGVGMHAWVSFLMEVRFPDDSLVPYCSARQGSTTLAFACAYRTLLAFFSLLGG